MKVSIIGLGYVGLPLALVCDEAGFDTYGVDTSIEKLTALKTKKIIVDDLYAAKLFKNSQIHFSSEVTESDIFVICVPTPIDHANKPNLDLIVAACDAVSKVVKSGNLVIIESTIYPGVCEEVVQPILSRNNDVVLIGHSPERVNPGDSNWTIKNIPRVVGGINERSVTETQKFYSRILDAEVTAVSSIRSAEASKMLENIFRDVNIALINEMAQAFYRMDIDVSEVIKAASTKPFGFMPHYPGIGVGGHCIAVDPYYMIERGREAGFDHEFLKIARKINSNMPIYTAYLVQNALNDMGLPIKGTKIGIYGLSYKPNVADTRESPSYVLINRLKHDKQADVKIFDPYLALESDFTNLNEFLDWCDVLVVCTAHSEIFHIKIESFKNIRLIIDGRNVLDAGKIKKLGIEYRGIGRR